MKENPGDEFREFVETPVDKDAFRTQRTWGSYTVLEESAGFKVKRIDVHPGASLSLQLHHQRSEHWVVVSGAAQIVNGENVLLLRPGEHTYIPVGCKHRLTNPGQTTTSLIEVQCGLYLGEDDIVRIEDLYGRTQDQP